MDFPLWSRAVTEWLSLFGIHLGAISFEEGSPIDRLIYIIMIGAGFMVLRRRGVRLAEIAGTISGWRFFSSTV